MQRVLNLKEYNSLITAMKYNQGEIFLTYVNEEIINSLVAKGFFKLKNDTATATKNVSTLFKINGEKAFIELLKL